METDKINNIGVTATTKDVKKVVLSDTAYLFYLTMKELIDAINKLSEELRR